MPNPLKIALIPNIANVGTVVVKIIISKYLTASGRTSGGIESRIKISRLKTKKITDKIAELISKKI